MSILFNWFKKKNEEPYIEDVPNFNMVPDNYTRLEVDELVQALKDKNNDLELRVKELSARQDVYKSDLEVKISEILKSGFITSEQLNFVVESLSSALREEIQDAINRRPAIIDPAPVSSPPAGWMYAIQDEIRNNTEATKAEVRAYVDDCFNAYDAEEDIELNEKFANLTPLSAEEIDALYMDEAETTTVANKTLNGFRAELYNKAVNELKLIPTSKATIAGVRAFLVKFVELMKPV